MIIRFVGIMVAFVMAGAAQAPRATQSNPESSSALAPETFPAPVNLKVLPGDLTGRQVHDIMEKWSSELGVRCSACHIKEPDGVIPAGPAPPRFADDSKPMKRIARGMYTMTEEINRNFISRVRGSAAAVSCGTCHRGNISPEPFVLSQEPEGPPTEAPSSGERPLSR